MSLYLPTCSRTDDRSHHGPCRPRLRIGIPVPTHSGDRPVSIAPIDSRFSWGTKTAKADYEVAHVYSELPYETIPMV